MITFLFVGVIIASVSLSPDEDSPRISLSTESRFISEDVFGCTKNSFFSESTEIAQQYRYEAFPRVGFFQIPSGLDFMCVNARTRREQVVD